MKPIRPLLATVLGLAVLAPLPPATALPPRDGATIASHAAADADADASIRPIVTATPAATPAATADATGISLSATPADAGLLRPDQPLRVNATIVNERSAPIADAVVTVHLAERRTVSAANLDSWFTTGENGDADRLVGTSSEVHVSPRASTTVAIEMPAAELGLGDPGAYQLTVSVASAGAPLATSRSAIVWNPDAVTSRLALGVVAPITAPAAAGGLIPAEALEQYTSPDGMLTRRLQAVIGRPVTIAVDPMVTASIRALGASAPAGATEWLTRLMSATNDSFALAYADADPTATLQAGGVLPRPTGFEFALDAADFATGPALPDGTEPALPTAGELMATPATLGPVSWPVPGTVTASDLELLRSAGYPRVMLDSADVEGEGQASSVDIDGTAAFVVHTELTRLLAAAVTAGSDTEWNRAASRLSSTLATAAQRSPAGRTIIVGVDRSDLTEFSNRLAPTLELLSTLPWMALSPISPTAEPTATASLTDGAQNPARLARVSQLLQAEQRDTAQATAAAEPSLITDERRLSLLSVLSQSLVDRPEEWSAASATFLQQSEALADAVHVTERGQILVLADRSQLPITVQNGLDQPAVVVLETRALTGGLAIEQQRIEVTIEPDSLRNVPVPVQSVSNGAVTVVVSLTSAAGVAIGDPVSLRVDVQAGWETAGFIVAVGIVVLVFVIGIVRTVLRRRRAAAEDDASEAGAEPDSDTDARARSDAGVDTESVPGPGSGSGTEPDPESIPARPSRDPAISPDADADAAPRTDAAHD